VHSGKQSLCTGESFGTEAHLGTNWHASLPFPFAVFVRRECACVPAAPHWL